MNIIFGGVQVVLVFFGYYNFSGVWLIYIKINYYSVDKYTTLVFDIAIYLPNKTKSSDKYLTKVLFGKWTNIRFFMFFKKLIL